MDQRLSLLRSSLQALEQQRFADLCQTASDALALDAGDVEARFLLALGLGAQGQTAAAAPLLNAVSLARPHHPHPCRDLASIRPHRDDTAIDRQYAACFALAPDDPSLRYAYAEHLQDHGQAGAADAMLAPVLATCPDHPQALRVGAWALADAGDLAGAIDRLQRAVALDPHDAAAWSNLGVLRAARGDLDSALAAHDQAIALRPDDAHMRVNRVVAQLRAGRLTEAWRDFEWRLRLPDRSDFPTALLMPDLATAPPLAGRTLLVTHEEGFGDTIQFARYLPLLAARGLHVLVAAPPVLRRLLSRLPGITLLADTDVRPGAAWRTVDYVCPFVSLPRIFATTLATIPPAPYLTADPADTTAWAARLSQGGRARGLRVGLVWAGQARPWLPGFATLDRRRSMNLATLAPLRALPGLRFVSLQKGPAAAAAADWPDMLDPMDDAHDFADTAAIIANLDLVISVDTAVAHLAGALGKPVYLLDRADSCWRWLTGRTDSPWYPTLRILRQTTIGDWTPVIAQVVGALEGSKAGAPPPPCFLRAARAKLSP